MGAINEGGCTRRLALGLALGGRWWAVNDHRFTEEAAPLFRLRVGEQRPLFRSTAEEKGGAIRWRVYAEARPSGVARGGG